MAPHWSVVAGDTGAAHEASHRPLPPPPSPPPPLLDAASCCICTASAALKAGRFLAAGSSVSLRAAGEVMKGIGRRML